MKKQRDEPFVPVPAWPRLKRATAQAAAARLEPLSMAKWRSPLVAKKSPTSRDG